MYEVRKQKQKELREKNWFYYALLAAGIFLFTQGSRLLSKSGGYAITSIFLGIITQSVSMEKLFLRIFKFNSHKNSKIAMIILLLIISVICYFINLKYIIIVLLNLTSIVLFILVSFIHLKFKDKKE